MITKGNGKENSLESKFKVTAEDKNKVTFANTFQESSTFHTCKLQRSTWQPLDSVLSLRSPSLFMTIIFSHNAMRPYEDILKLRFGHSHLSYNIILQFSA